MPTVPGRVFLLLLFCVTALPVLAQPRPEPDLAAAAMVRQLNAELLSNNSATAVLQRWCDQHGVAPGERIAARRTASPPAETPADVRTALQAGPGETVIHRRVDLVCGDVVLSRADNWYRPARLTPEMNRLLDTTQTPFGVVVRDLGYQRRNRGVVMPDLAAGALPAVVLQHNALLVDRTGAPFSLVVENYLVAMIEVSRAER